MILNKILILIYDYINLSINIWAPEIVGIYKFFFYNY